MSFYLIHLVYNLLKGKMNFNGREYNVPEKYQLIKNKYIFLEMESIILKILTLI